MIVIKILGSGCANCRRLTQLAEIALEKAQGLHPDLEGSIEKVTDMASFMDYELMSTPGLVINEKLVSSGRLPSPDTIVGWIEAAVVGV